MSNLNYQSPPNLGGAVPMPPQRREIPEQTSRVHCAIEQLEGSLQALAGRLEGALSPEGPADPGKKGDPCFSKQGIEIQSAADRIFLAQAFVGRILERLQLCWLLLAVAVALVARPAAAAGKPDSGWFDQFSVSGIGALKTADLNGESQWGAGVGVGYRVNPFVELRVDNLAFEGPGQTTTPGKKPGTSTTTSEDSWGGLLVDETDFYARAKLTRWSSDTVTLFVQGGGQYEWNEKAFGIGVGGGISLNFSKPAAPVHVHLDLAYTVRAWFSDLHDGQSADGLATASLGLDF